MKKGFTMIELIFVIVILGILAAVAIPKLAATRDDAEIAKTAANIQPFINDLGSYYTSQGEFADASKMSNVKSPIEIKSQKCLTVGTGNATSGEIGLEIGVNGLCAKVWELPGLANVKTLIESSDNKTANTLKFGGMGIKY